MNPSSNPWRALLDAIAVEEMAALVTVQAVEGSAPREAGARLVARPSGGFAGTVGGGLLERDALAEAGRALAAGRGPARRLARLLGPDLGQCCGGRVALLVETFSGQDRPALERLAAVADGPARSLVCGLDAEGRVARTLDAPAPSAGGWREPTGTDALPLLLFGAGHVGRALVLALAPLPVAVRWVDPRAEAFPSRVPANVVAVRAQDPVREVEAAPAGAAVLVMTHSHPLDLAVTAAALARLDLPFVGLIGSATKRARFRGRLRALGIPEARIAALACPIGIPGIAGKAPAIIAASVAAQVLQVRDAAGQDRLPRSDAA